ncbi:MAG TPA: YicC/YloC family endoribonuclease [Clostridia bacterium]|nr:YicC/YloC family endoribonuclease [Clostridia bacterium]
MKSMTGYGKGEASHSGKSVKVEMKSVNNRFLDLNIKLPKTFNSLEDTVRKNIQQVVERGHIDVYINYANNSAEAGGFKANVELAKNYLATVATLAAEVGIEDDLTLTSLLKAPDIIERCEPEEDEDELKTLLVLATVSALTDLEEMRIAEGQAIAEDMTAKLKVVESFVAKIAERAPFVVIEYREHLMQRLAELTENIEVDAARIATEVSIFADRCSIDEELTRLNAHFSQLAKFISSDGVVGRKIDFLIQELNRETNTIGSKANDLIVTQNVLKLKNEIEKIREQVQNIE